MNRIKQVLYNLLSNAITNTHENGVIQVNIKTSSSGDSVIIEVIDNGAGISPNRMETIFMLKENDFNHRRIAFGLPISYKICEKLGEGLVVESKIGEGTKFSFAIDVIQSTYEGAQPNNGKYIILPSPQIYKNSVSPKSTISNKLKEIIKSAHIRARSQLNKLDRHATPTSSVDVEVTSVKTSKKASYLTYLNFISHEINQQLRIRSASDPHGKNKRYLRRESIRRKLQLQKVSGVAEQINNILRKDKQHVISDAILNKCSTSQLSSFFHSDRHSPSKPTNINIKSYASPIYVIKSEGEIPSLSEIMDVAEEEIQQINLPKCEEPKMLPKTRKNVPPSFCKGDYSMSGGFDMEELVHNIAKRIKICKNCKCPQILIVDDNDFIRYSLDMQLKKLGLLADQAINGLVAVEKTLERGRCMCKGYKLIFMDIDMPVLDGLGATRKIISGIKSNKVYKDVVVVGVSAFSSTEDIQKCMKSGMKDFSIILISSKAVYP